MKKPQRISKKYSLAIVPQKQRAVIYHKSSALDSISIILGETLANQCPSNNEIPCRNNYFFGQIEPQLDKTAGKGQFLVREKNDGGENKVEAAKVLRPSLYKEVRRSNLKT